MFEVWRYVKLCVLLFQDHSREYWPAQVITKCSYEFLMVLGVCLGDEFTVHMLSPTCV